MINIALAFFIWAVFMTPVVAITTRGYFDPELRKILWWTLGLLWSFAILGFIGTAYGL